MTRMPQASDYSNIESIQEIARTIEVAARTPAGEPRRYRLDVRRLAASDYEVRVLVDESGVWRMLPGALNFAADDDIDAAACKGIYDLNAVIASGREPGQ